MTAPVLPVSANASVFTLSTGTASLGNMPGVVFEPGNSCSFEIWAYFDVLPDSMNLISRATEFVLETAGSSLSATVSGYAGGAVVAEDVFEPGNWYYIVATFDGSTLKLYIDGYAVASKSLSGNGVTNSGNDLLVGGTFFGQVDTVRVWNIILGVNTIYSDGFTDYNAGTSGLLAQIDFSQSPPADTSGNGVTVTTTEGVELESFTPAVELVEGAFCDPYDDVTVNPAGSQSSFSVVAWVQPNYLQGTEYIFSNGALSSGGTLAAGMSLSVSSQGNVQFQIGGATPIVSAAQITTTSWSNVACTWTSGGNAALFVNGNADTTGTMTWSTALTNGAPLIGSIAQPGGPVSSFQGYIQSVAVLNTALSLTTIQGYNANTSNPINNSNVTAIYDFSQPIAQNTITFTPIGLVGGAQLTTMVSAPSPFAAGITAAAPEPQRALPAAPHVPPDEFTAAKRQAMVTEFRRFMTETLHLPAQEQEGPAALMEENLGHVARSLAEGTAAQPYRLSSEVRPDGWGVIYLHTAEGTTVVYEGPDAGAVSWTVIFIFTLFSTIMTTFGLTINGPGVTTFANWLSPRIGAYTTALQSLFTNAGGPSPSVLMKAVKALYEAKLLFPLLSVLRQVAFSSISAITLFQIGLRLVALISPAAPLQTAVFVAQLALNIADLVTQWQSPDNPWTQNLLQQPAHNLLLQPSLVT